MDKGLGSVTWWGFSPALDLLDYYKLLKPSLDVSEVNILLIGGADFRHALHTFACRNRHRRRGASNSKVKINVYVMENNLEVYARSLLLTALALELPGVMGLQEKTEIFTEIFGNSLVRQQTATYIQMMSQELIEMVTDFDVLHGKLPLVNLGLLKYKERDMLEGIFKLWRTPESTIFDIANYWDLRIRQHLGTRYDSCKGVFDWDYSMKLCDRGAEIISNRNYCKWRQSGVAFELREGSYSVPNKTLASGMILKVDGERIGRRGYWGDIVVSPYISYGIECEDDSYYKKANKEYISNSQMITQHNLTAMLSELLTGQRYVPTQPAEPPQNHPKTILESVEEDVGEDNPHSSEPASSNAHSGSGTSGRGNRARVNSHQFHQLEDVTVNFLPLQSLPSIQSKQKYQHLFDVVYFSNSMVHHLLPGVADLFADDALVVLETAKFVVELNKDQYMDFTTKINGMAKSVGCEPLVACDAEKDAFSFHKYHRH